MEEEISLFDRINNISKENIRHTNKLLYKDILKLLNYKLSKKAQESFQISLSMNMGIRYSFDNNFFDEYFQAFYQNNDMSRCIYEILTYIGMIDETLPLNDKYYLLDLLKSYYTNHFADINFIEDQKILFISSPQDYFSAIPITVLDRIIQREDIYELISDDNYRLNNAPKISAILACILETKLSVGFIYFNGTRHINTLVEFNNVYLDPKLNLCIPKIAYKQLFRYEEFSATNAYEACAYLKSQYNSEEILKDAFNKVYKKEVVKDEKIR